MIIPTSEAESLIAQWEDAKHRLKNGDFSPQDENGLVAAIVGCSCKLVMLGYKMIDGQWVLPSELN